MTQIKRRLSHWPPLPKITARRGGDHFFWTRPGSCAAPTSKAASRPPPIRASDPPDPFAFASHPAQYLLASRIHAGATMESPFRFPRGNVRGIPYSTRCRRRSVNCALRAKCPSAPTRRSCSPLLAVKSRRKAKRSRETGAGSISLYGGRGSLRTSFANTRDRPLLRSGRRRMLHRYAFSVRSGRRGENSHEARLARI